MVKDYGPMMRRSVLFCGLCADDMRYNKTVRLRLVTTRAGCGILVRREPFLSSLLINLEISM